MLAVGVGAEVEMPEMELAALLVKATEQPPELAVTVAQLAEAGAVVVDQTVEVAEELETSVSVVPAELLVTVGVEAVGLAAAWTVEVSGIHDVQHVVPLPAMMAESVVGGFAVMAVAAFAVLVWAAVLFVAKVYVAVVAVASVA